MSYEISYRRQAFKLPAARIGYHDDIVFLVEEVGSNNCWEIGNRRRARDWQCTAAGAAYECLSAVTQLAAACCGGSLVLYGRRHITPEAYIRAWRRSMAEAAPFEEASKLGFSLRLFTRITDAEAADGRKDTFDSLNGQQLVVGRRCELHDGNGWEWRFSAFVPDQVKLWLETRGSGRAWRSVEVSGPNE